LVEHVTLNHGVVSSILTEPTKGIR